MGKLFDALFGKRRGDWRKEFREQDFVAVEVNAEVVEIPKPEVVEPFVAVPPEPVRYREPVQVLIDSLNDDWWDFEVDFDQNRFTWDFQFVYVVRHQWLGNTLKFRLKREYCHNSYFPTRIEVPIVDEGWMTKEEREAVAKVTNDAYKRLQERRAKRKEEIKSDLEKVREQEFFKLLELREELCTK